jgi:hypothetical protein
MALIDAVGAFLGPIMAEYCRLIDEGDPAMPLTISLGGYQHETTLGVLQEIDRAYLAARERNDKATCTRRNRKAVGPLL